jgi:hypothetical protein
MGMQIQGKEFTFDSSDPKTSEILAKYGNVFGLTSENERRTWVEVVRPFTIDRIKQITGAT